MCNLKYMAVDLDGADTWCFRCAVILSQCSQVVHCYPYHISTTHVIRRKTRTMVLKRSFFLFFLKRKKTNCSKSGPNVDLFIISGYT